eukprot:164395-Pyramimonas_sp.AAC.1
MAVDLIDQGPLASMPIGMQMMLRSVVDLPHRRWMPPMEKMPSGHRVASFDPLGLFVDFEAARCG